ncbi:hypothetical protein BH11MYX4_BH11MYX4_24620 [soil metagenome]
MRLRRRDLLKAATAAFALCTLPIACSKEHAPPATGVFRHGVASGDPLPDAVILWTRVTSDGDRPAPAQITWEMAKDPSFAVLTASGIASAEAEREFTVKVDATGLEAGTTYYYRFRGLGEESVIGRTRTAPRTAARLRFAVVSCASLPHGYFHVYQAIAERRDIDAVLHVGDYLYEYKDGEYGSERPSLPANEIVTLADYRARYAQYRGDQNLREIHRQHPFVTTWDDHEVADNASKDGAGNHDEATEGSYADRKRAAIRAYGEWMPIRGDLADGKIWRTLRYGDLADLIVLDTRHWGKEKQSSDTDPARDADARQLLGVDQEAWLFDQLRTSKATWKVVCQQVLVSPLPQYLNTDQWDGYPKARDRFYDAIEKNAVTNVVVLTGDIHASFANDLARRPTEPGGYDGETGRGSLAVELVTPAVTSETPSKPKDAGELMDQNAWMKHVDLDRHGYVLLDLDEERAQGAFFYVKDVESRNGQEAVFAKAVATRSGTNHLRDDGQAAPERADAPALAPQPTLAAPAALRALPASKPSQNHDPFGPRRRRGPT